MLKMALMFLLISLVAGILGFSSISVLAAAIAKILFFVTLLLGVLFLMLAFLVGGWVTHSNFSDWD